MIRGMNIANRHMSIEESDIKKLKRRAEDTSCRIEGLEKNIEELRDGVAKLCEMLGEWVLDGI